MWVCVCVRDGADKNTLFKNCVRCGVCTVLAEKPESLLWVVVFASGTGVATAWCVHTRRRFNLFAALCLWGVLNICKVFSAAQAGFRFRAAVFRRPGRASLCRRSVGSSGVVVMFFWGSPCRVRTRSARPGRFSVCAVVVMARCLSKDSRVNTKGSIVVCVFVCVCRARCVQMCEMLRRHTSVLVQRIFYCIGMCVCLFALLHGGWVICGWGFSPTNKTGNVHYKYCANACKSLFIYSSVNYKLGLRINLCRCRCWMFAPIVAQRPPSA